MPKLHSGRVVVFNHGKYQYGQVSNKYTRRQRVMYEVKLDNGNTLIDVPVDNLKGSLYIHSKLSKLEL